MIRPLSGKYYGTEIEITYEGHHFILTLWNSADYIPSDRELGEMSIEEWLRDGYGSGGHFESKVTYNLAKKIDDFLEKEI